MTTPRTTRIKAEPTSPTSRLMTEEDIEIERLLAIFDHTLDESEQGERPPAEVGGPTFLGYLRRALRLAEKLSKHRNLLKQQSLQIKAQTAEIAELRQAIVALRERDLQLERAGSAVAQATDRALVDFKRQVGLLEAGLQRGKEN